LYRIAAGVDIVVAMPASAPLRIASLLPSATEIVCALAPPTTWSHLPAALSRRTIDVRDTVPAHCRKETP
jgi:hypothetical protein